MLQVHFDGLVLTASAVFGSDAFIFFVATFKRVHSYVTSTASIFGAVMLQVYFDRLVFTASAAFAFIFLPRSQCSSVGIRMLHRRPPSLAS
jgi:hypothetical protein